MDLALEMGMTTAGLARAMTERELREWQQFVARKMLPTRKTHLLLAQIAMVIAQCMGGAKNVKLSDFLLEAQDDPAEDAEELTAEDVASFFGGTVVRKAKD